MTSEKARTAPAHEGRDPVPGTTLLGVLTEVGFVGAGLACYLVVRWYTLGSTDEAISNAGDVLRLERLLGLDWEHAIQDATMSVPGLSAFFTLIYVWGYLPALVGITLWLYVRHRESYVTMRNALLASGVVGLVVYAVYPCAPPWIGGGHGFTDTVAEGSFASVARPPGITNHLGAIPSFHVGWVILAGLVVLRVASSRTLRVLCFLYPALMGYAVISTGNHWVLDIPAGVVLAIVGMLGATLLAPGPRSPTRPSHTAAGAHDMQGPARRFHLHRQYRDQVVGVAVRSLDLLTFQPLGSLARLAGHSQAASPRSRPVGPKVPTRAPI